MRTVIGMFDDPSEAKLAIDQLQNIGARDISVISRNERVGDLGLSPIELRGIGRVSAMGPLTNFLTAQTARAEPDGIAAALTAMGLSREDAARYVQGVRDGYTLETATIPDDKAQEALAIMKEHSTAQGRRAKSTGEGDTVLPVIAEEMQVGKREVSAGGVAVTSHVQEVPVEQDVQLREEHIDIERRPADRPVGRGEHAFEERTVEVSAMAEEPVVQKTARVVEEVVVHKDVGARTETIRDTVRRTDVDVQRFDPSQYEEHLRSRYGREAKLEEYEPAYRFGGQLRSDERFSGRDWSEIEPHAQEHWEKKKPGTWERFKDAVKHAFGK